jgi:hypothetical protein
MTNLDLLLLHLLPQLGELGGRFTRRLSLAFGHGGDPSAQFYQARADGGRMTGTGAADMALVNTDWWDQLSDIKLHRWCVVDGQ